MFAVLIASMFGRVDAKPNTNVQPRVAAVVQKTSFVDPLDVPAVMHQSIAGRPLMAVARAGKRLVAVGMRGLIAISDDDGKTWAQVSALVSSDLLAMSFPTALEGWAVGHDGVVLHTADGGKTWNKQFDGRMAATALTGNYRSRIAAGDAVLQPYLDQLILDYKNGPTLPLLGVLFMDTQHGLAVGPFGVAIETNDGGKTWVPILDRIENPEFLHLNAVVQVSGNIYIAGEKGAVFKLDPSSGRFHRIQTGYAGSLFGLTGDGEVLFAYGLRGTVYRSVDRGATWSPLHSPLRGLVTGAAYMVQRHAFVFVTAAGEIALADPLANKLRLLNASRPTVITGVQALSDGELVLSGLDGVAHAALQQLNLLQDKEY